MNPTDAVLLPAVAVAVTVAAPAVVDEVSVTVAWPLLFVVLLVAESVPAVVLHVTVRPAPSAL
ncbi:hypothetical protein AB4Y38_42965, partial [Paraburkholderia sp. EG285A]|uniref:hypothetical protein n=1 Tax=Paraburkholderia sp. EG285A TaxID=3237009 RepID=UPI0034D1D49A